MLELCHLILNKEDWIVPILPMTIMSPVFGKQVGD